MLLPSCQKSDSVTAQLNKINFRIVTMDKNNIETSVFKTGDDMVLAFKIINNSELKINAESLICELLQKKDFLLVNKKTDNSENIPTIVPVGRLFAFPTYCETIDIPYDHRNIPKGETFLFSSSWRSNTDNADLAAGKYFIQFDLTINIDGIRKTWNLRYDFEVN